MKPRRSNATRNAVAALLALAVALSACVCVGVSAFYLPGVAPREYADGEMVELKVNKLDSTVTQLPYDFYSLPFCQPDRVEEAAENLGEVLSGDRIENSAYIIITKMSRECEILCWKDYSDEELNAFASKIADKYRINWLVDNLPAASKWYTVPESDEDNDAAAAAAANDPEQPVNLVPHYDKGFDMGFVGSNEIPQSEPDVRYVYNHVNLIIFYHSDPQNYQGVRIVGFEVEPFSIKHQVDGEPSEQNKPKTCSFTRRTGGQQGEYVPQRVSHFDSKATARDKQIIWTYDVTWKESNVKWASRWDLYLKMTDSQIHWFSITNSIMIVLFLSGMVAMIMFRTLHRDVVRYNTADASEEEAQEETGWKLIHGEVFRPPAYGGVFSIFVGTGVQVFAMTLLTLVFAVLGLLSPANRGGLMTALLLLFVFMGVFAGYYSTRTYKMFKLTEWRKNTLYTALMFPGMFFGIFFVLNLVIWGEKSSGAVPFGTLVALLVLWFGISLPLVYLGSYFAFRKADVEPPVRVNLIPRMILPDRPWYTQPQFSILIGGILPFGAVFIEIFFIMSSVWLQQFYYVFGFLFIVFIILIITCAEIAIVMCYFQLCSEDYHWWWRSYLTSGSSALYLFVYSIVYFVTKLEVVQFVSGLLFFGYMTLVSLAFFVLTGTIGFVACYLFVTKIYGSIHVD